MVKKLRSLIVLFAATITLSAQPDIDFSHNGCHHFQNREAIAEAMRNVAPVQLTGFNDRSDTIDILHYDITIDPTVGGGDLAGVTTVTFVPKMNDVNWINLDLEGLNVSLVTNGAGDTLTFTQTGTLQLNIPLGQAMNVGDTSSVTVTYAGEPITCPSGFGGYYYEDNYAYNLSIGLAAYPHNFGRAWFPCFDNFAERSFYTFRIITGELQRAKASGEFVEVIDLSGGKKMWIYEMNKPLPTYLASTAMGRYESIRWKHTGEFGDVPIEIMARAPDSNDVKSAFRNLPAAIGTFEDWYGQMVWSSVGYSMATRGAMENPNNIIYPQNSATNGNSNDRLMAHELCHQWWGNAVNPKTSMDMWIKEGNAEYGAHLFFEKTQGDEVFWDVVGGNLAEVLKTAHVNDDEYRALSPMPPTHTYGTHTYNKGASMIHNMRAYMGDSLFEVGQKAVLKMFEFQPMDAYEYRDQLTAATGVDMTDYFDAWIFAPGFSDFEVDSFDVASAGAEFDVTVHIQQKLLATPEFHKNIPVFLTFVDENRNEQIERIMMSGEFFAPTIRLPFAPKHVFLNTNQQVNLAQLTDTKYIEESGSVNFGNTNFSFNAQEVTAPAFLNLTHHYTAPDHPSAAENPFNARFSTSHFWSIRGDMPDDFVASANLEYDGTENRGFIDADLVEFTEDSLILVWRRSPAHRWVEFPDYRKIDFNGGDKKGFIRISNLQVGDYAYANGNLEVVSADEPDAINFFTEVFPNPASDEVTVKGFYENLRSDAVHLVLTDALGRQVFKSEIPLAQGQFEKRIDVSVLPDGAYFSNIYTAQNQLLEASRLFIH